MITVDKQDAITLKLSQVMAASKKTELDFYLFVPGELGLGPEVIKESEIYFSSLHQKRTYFSDKTHLPLVHSRLAKRGIVSSAQYRVSLSLYGYQYVVALDKSVADLNAKAEKEQAIDEDSVDDVIDLALDILKRLRRSVPFDEGMKRYYANIDNYLSWYTEQQFLSLVAHLPREGDYKTVKERLLTIAEKEIAHRKLNNYNSENVRKSATRMSNKMRLLRRLIEHPIVLKEESTSLGANLQRMVKGIATGFVMVFVTVTAIMARDYWGEITASFIIAMSFVYALREIFKDDLRDIMWRWVRKGRAKWRRRYFDPTTKKAVGQKLEWLEFTSLSKLPDRIKTIRKKRVAQREEQILHYRYEVEMATSRFLSGYEQTRENLYLNMRFLTRLMDKGSNKIYRLNNGQVVKDSVEKRHLLNLIAREVNEKGEATYYRWKLVMNRSKVVDVEAIPVAEMKPKFLGTDEVTPASSQKV
ncbi:hypothetical protein GT360_07055 [Vibrio astriarenae]|uniref:Uncharacterized protein n=1 Tax=Vibrio astriarenae TaxID=1481923 RepID=A0A7Z2YDD6_9VIBR|nr:hypothetical protein [Vibrio astriarenae]QIA63288.1 hypothetical protein GT360_07055 [Vibrio astriarenae]